MPPQKYPFIVDGIHGDVPINMYAAADSERGVILQPHFGLLEHCQLTGCTEVRGMWPWVGDLYVVARRGTESVLWRVDTAGGFRELGRMTTSSTGPVWMRNNQTQLCVVDGVSGYVYTVATGHFTQITDPNFPGASTMDYQDGMGLFTKPASNQWFFSSLYDFTVFDALNFYTKESKPDNIVGLMTFMREPYICGGDATEVWYNAGGDNSSADNPTFARNSGGLILYGLAAPKAITDLAGVAALWLTQDGQLLMAQGYSGQVVSNRMFDRATEAMALASTFGDCQSFSFRAEGHVFGQFNFPSGNVSWLFDATTGLMSKRMSYLEAGGYGRHRANCYALLDNIHYVGDYINGKVYKMGPSYYDDDGHDILRQVCSQEVDGGLTRIAFPPVQIIMEAGVGDLVTANPQIGLEFSKDGGNSWSSMVTRSAGQVGETKRRALWNQVGSDYRRMYRISMSDPVLWRILGIDGWGAAGQ